MHKISGDENNLLRENEPCCGIYCGANGRDRHMDEYNNEDNRGIDISNIYQKEQINDMGSATMQSARGAIHCLTIVGQVEGHQLLPENTKSTKYEHIMPMLAAIEESEEIDALLILLNTVGGDIEAGLGIAELISGMKKPTCSLVLGGGHSIGVPLAVAAKRSYIALSAAMTIHPVRLTGVVIGVPQTFNYFAKIQERIVRFVTSNSKIPAEVFLEYMMRTGEMANDVGSVIYGQEAVDSGLIDALGGLSDALAYLHEEIKKKRDKMGRENKDAAATE